MSFIIEAVDQLVASPSVVEAVEEVKCCKEEVQPAPVNLYDELEKQSFSFLLAIKEFLISLLEKKAAEEKALLLEKSAELSSYFGVEVNALLNPPKGKDSKAKGKSRGKVESGVKYRDPNGNTWTGKGPKPGWMKAAIEQGVDPESFRV